MPNEREVLRALVEVADTFVDDYDVVDFLHGLAERCVALLDVDEAGVMLIDTTDARCATSRRRASRCGSSSCSSSSTKRARVSMPTAAGRSTVSTRCRRSGAAVAAASDPTRRGRVRIARRRPDAPARRHDRRPQPLLAPARWPEPTTISTSRRPWPTSPRSASCTQRAIHDGQVVTAQLQTALESRIAIEQAKGILAEHMAISVDDAFTLLRNYSRANNSKLTETARASSAAPCAPPRSPRDAPKPKPKPTD